MTPSVMTDAEVSSHDDSIPKIVMLIRISFDKKNRSFLYLYLAIIIFALPALLGGSKLKQLKRQNY